MSECIYLLLFLLSSSDILITERQRQKPWSLLSKRKLTVSKCLASTLLRGYVSVYNPAAQGSNPKHNINAFFNWKLNCDVKRTKFSKNGRNSPIFRKKLKISPKQREIYPDFCKLWALPLSISTYMRWIKWLQLK